jgi:hypothetical protein
MVSDSKIIYTPYQELVIHEIIEQTNSNTFFEDIVRLALSGPVQVQPSINWIDGVAFFIAPMQPTPEVVKENLAGRVHYGSVLFTRTEYKPQITVKIGNQDFTVRLRKAEDNPTLVGLAAYLKNFKTTGHPNQAHPHSGSP